MTSAPAAIAALLIGYAAVSRRLGRLNVSGAMFFTTTGLLVGPVLGLLDLRLQGEQVKLLAEITLTLVLFADASRISLRALRSEYAVPLRLLGIGLPLTIVAGALVAVAVVPGIGLAEALVLAIVLACTDAALGQAVVSDERVPSRVRQGLNVESGLNDGLCVPLFFIAIAIAEAEAGTESSPDAATLVLEQIGYGLAGGVVAGLVGGIALVVATRRRLIEPHWVQILSVASALLAAGIADALGGSIFIAAFTGGFVFGALRRDTGGEVTRLVDEAGEVFNAVTFIVFGAVILGALLDEITWQIVLFAILSLTVVRMLPVALALLGTGARAPTVAFLGVVRAARTRLDRVRGHPARRHDRPPPPHAARRHRRHHRALDLRARPHGAPAHRALRALVGLASARCAARHGERARRRASPPRPADTLGLGSPGRPHPGHWQARPLAPARRDRKAPRMTIGASLFCIAVGAILRFAVTAEVSGIDLQVVGVILMVIGVVGLVLGLVLLNSRRRAAETVDERYP